MRLSEVLADFGVVVGSYGSRGSIQMKTGFPKESLGTSKTMMLTAYGNAS
jgi:hypothetical protein